MAGSLAQLITGLIYGMICEGLFQAAQQAAYGGPSPRLALLVAGRPHHVPILSYALSAGDSLSGGLARQHNSNA